MKEWKGYAILAAAVALALLGAGCTTAPGANNTTATATATTPSGSDLVGTWQLTSFLGQDGQTVQAVAGSVPLVTFDRSGGVAGTVGCNHFTATYTASGNQIAFGPTASTVMYCTVPAGAMDQEMRVFELFPLTAGYTVAGNTLTLLDRSGRPVMTFTRASQPPNAPLVETVWRLSGFSDNATARSALAGSNATVVFGPDGRVTGTTGCNDISGPYTTNGNAIAIGPLAVTQRACVDPSVGAQERELLQALRLASSYETRGDQLTMTDATGGQSVQFVRAA